MYTLKIQPDVWTCEDSKSSDIYWKITNETSTIIYFKHFINIFYFYFFIFFILLYHKSYQIYIFLFFIYHLRVHLINSFILPATWIFPSSCILLHIHESSPYFSSSKKLKKKNNKQMYTNACIKDIDKLQNHYFQASI